MSTPSRVLSSDTIIYPESDGKSMADNTKQFRWIVTIKENLEILYAGQDMQGWVSPCLQIRFEFATDTLAIHTASGEKLLTSVELVEERNQIRQQAAAERQKIEPLAARPGELGIDLDLV